MADNSTAAGIKRRQVLAGAAAGAVALRQRAGAAEIPFVPYSNKSLDFYFFVCQQEAVKRAVEAKGWRFQAVNSNFDTTAQLEQWNSLLLSNPAAIISDPIDSQAWPGSRPPRRNSCGYTCKSLPG